MNKLFIFPLIISISIITCAEDTKKLPIIAHWSFDNDSKDTLSDSGPNKLDAKLQSKNKNAKVTTAKGMKGKALLLNSEDKIKYIINDKKGLLNLKPPYTICAWVKKTAAKPKSMCIFSKKSDSHSTGYDFRISWNMLNSRIGNGHKSFSVFSPYKSVKDNTWYHLAVSNDGKKISLFINGEQVKIKNPIKNVSNLIPQANSSRAVIANYIGRNDAYNFIGLIDELYIIDKVLTNDELFQLAVPEDE